MARQHKKGKYYKISRVIKRFLKICTIIFVCFWLIMIIFAFTSIPFHIFYWLGTKNIDKVQIPDAIVLLSGGGMPSKDGLLRAYFTARAGELFPDAQIIIAIPGDTTDTNSSVIRTYNELLLRKIDSSRIFFETEGTNTRYQALQIKDKFPSITKDSVILVTIPSHIRRAVKTFEKAGFENTGSFPTFERVIESDLKFDDKKLGGRKLIPDVGNQINLRYRFWGYLQLEIVILREFFAMGYYKLKGWI